MNTRSSSYCFLKSSISLTIALALFLQPLLQQAAFATAAQAENASHETAANPMLTGPKQAEVLNSELSAIAQKLIENGKKPTLENISKGIKKHPSTLSKTQSDAKNSTANNFTLPVNVSVNERSGNLQMQIPIESIDLIKGMPIDLTLQYDSSRASQTFLGLPPGWTYAWLAYVDVSAHTGETFLHMTGGQNYEIDTRKNPKDPWPQGLRYYYLKDVSVDKTGGTIPDHILLYNKDDDRSYQYKVVSGISATNPHGLLTQYFDSLGFLIAMEDNNKNNIVFHYIPRRNGENLDIHTSYLKGVKDNLGHKYVFDYETSGSWTLNMPDGRTYHMLTNGDTLKKFTNPKGEDVTIENDPRYTQVSSPTGSRIRATFENEIKVKDYPIRLPVVSEIETWASKSSEPSRVTYRYDNPDFQGDQRYQNFTGYPKYSPINSDGLLQSMDTNYFYKTTIDNGVTKTVKKFNFLHLDASSEVYNVPDGGKRPSLISNSENTYVNFGHDYRHLPQNYQLPEKITTEVHEGSDETQHIKYTDYDEFGKLKHEKNEERVRNPDGSLGNLFTIKETNISYEGEGTTHPKMITTTEYRTKENPSAEILIQRKEVTYDGNGNPTREEHGYVVSGTFNPEKVTTYQYADVSFSVAGETKVSHLLVSQTTQWAKPSVHSGPAWQTISYNYTYENGNLIQSTTTSGPDITPVTSRQTISWNTGLVKSETDGQGNTTYYDHDILGRTIEEISPAGLKTRYAYTDDPNGDNVVTTTSPNGYVLDEHSDGLGRETKTVDNLLGKSKPLSVKHYNALGQLDSEKNAYDLETKYHYDTQGRLKETIDPFGNVESYTYNAALQTKTVSLNNHFLKIQYLNEKGEVEIENSYPALENSPDNALCVSTKPCLQNSIVAHNGLEQVVSMVTKTLPLKGGNGAQKFLSTGSAHQTVISDVRYDADGNQIEAKSKGWDGIAIDTKWNLDLFGNVVSKNIEYTDPHHGIAHSKGTDDVRNYDALNRLHTVCNVNGQCNEYTYYPNGTVKTFKDYSKNVFTYTYDADGRVKTKEYNEKGTTHKTEYDYNTTTGQLLSVKKDSQTLSYEYYNPLEGKQGLKKIIYPDGKTVSFDYDSYGRLRSTTDIMGLATNYSYNSDSGRPTNNYDPNQLWKVANGRDEVVYDYYTKEEDLVNNGKVKTVRTGGIETKYEYFKSIADKDNEKVKENPNNFQNVKKVTSVKTSTGEKIQEIEYQHDDNQNVAVAKYSSHVFQGDPNANYTEEYTYNSLSELTKTVRYNPQGKILTTTTFQYDANGNVTENSVHDSSGKILEGSKEFKYKDASGVYSDNKIVSVKSHTPAGWTAFKEIQYDTNGNLLADENGNKYFYDMENKLVRFEGFNKTGNKVEAKYSYYPDDMRASKQITVDNNKSDPIFFYYDGSENANIVNEVQKDITSSYFMVGSTRIARYLSNDTDQKNQKYYLNNQKDTTVLLDKNVTKDGSTTYSYTPYGELVKPQAQSAVAKKLTVSAYSIAENAFQYSGEYTDSESGLQYLRARYYNPSHMHFMTRDISGAQRNHYMYASGNPIMEADPSGMFPEWAKIAIGITAGIILGAAGGAAGAALGAKLGIMFGAAIGSIAGGALGGELGTVGADLVFAAVEGKNAAEAGVFDDIAASLGIGMATGIVGAGIGRGIGKGIGKGVSKYKAYKAKKGASTPAETPPPAAAAETSPTTAAAPEPPQAAESRVGFNPTTTRVAYRGSQTRGGLTIRTSLLKGESNNGQVPRLSAVEQQYTQANRSPSVDVEEQLARSALERERDENLKRELIRLIQNGDSNRNIRYTLAKDPFGFKSE